MNEWMQEYCDFLSNIYNCTYYVKNNILFIKSNNETKSTFKVSLNDKNLPYYTLYHRSSHKIQERYHTQYKNKNLKKIIFVAMTHDLYKENNMFYNEEDFYRTVSDVSNIINNREIESKYKNIGYIVCPICKRKLNIYTVDGGIRKNIHCKCKIGYHHTYIKYVYNKGYYLMFKDKYGNVYKNGISKIIPLPLDKK